MKVTRVKQPFVEITHSTTIPLLYWRTKFNKKTNPLIPTRHSNADFIAAIRDTAPGDPPLNPSKISAPEELIASILVSQELCCSEEEIKDNKRTDQAGTVGNSNLILELEAVQISDMFLEGLKEFCRQNSPALNRNPDDWFLGLIQFPSKFLFANFLALSRNPLVDDFSSSFCAKVFVAALTGFDDQHRLSAAPQSGIQPPSSPSVRVSVANTPQLFSIREGGFEENKSEDADSAIVDSPPNTSSSSR